MSNIKIDGLQTSDKFMDEMQSMIERCQQASKKRNNNQPHLQAEEKPEPSQLPLWPDPARAVPNSILRSALFGIVKKGHKSYLKKEKLASYENMELYYTGEQLDQGDLDVWECILHVARLQELGNKCTFTAYEFLKILNKTNSGENRKILNNRLLRLKANAIEIKQRNLSYMGSLIDEVYKDEDTQKYVVVLNPKLKILFEADQYSMIDWNIRQSLNGKYLAQWLHGFYASHAQPYPISISKLSELCGSETQELWKFTQTLKKNLDDLKAAKEKYGECFEYEIKDQLLHVYKQPSQSQIRHLQKKLNKK
jgi:hypothetical protein